MIWIPRIYNPTRHLQRTNFYLSYVNLIIVTYYFSSGSGSRLLPWTLQQLISGKGGKIKPWVRSNHVTSKLIMLPLGHLYFHSCTHIDQHLMYQSLSLSPTELNHCTPFTPRQTHWSISYPETNKVSYPRSWLTRSHFDLILICMSRSFVRSRRKNDIRTYDHWITTFPQVFDESNRKFYLKLNYTFWSP